ncbi:MAG: hypothetical protein M3083_14260 [Actinomycetota bacterium]|nr:hypothetical protein [Actinomycetota bacterium]
MGTPAPEFSPPGLHGERLTLNALRASARPVLLIFTDPTCRPGVSLMPISASAAGPRGRRDHRPHLPGHRDANRAKTSEHGDINVLLQRDYEVARPTVFAGLPSGVLVGAAGVIASPMVAGSGLIGRMVQSVLGPQQVHFHPHVATPQSPGRAPDSSAGTSRRLDRDPANCLQGQGLQLRITVRRPKLG